jgi:methionyl-tRNA synthetase
MRYLIIYIKKLFFYLVFLYYICSMKENIFITTTLPYPNAEYPHVGFLFESLLADSINRFYKSMGFNTFFNTGLDEEGLKIYQKAKSLNLTPQEYLNIVAPNYIDFCKKYQIEYDNFYRTSLERHSKKVQDIWLQLLKKGHIYKKKYSGKYCIGCESFKTDKELIENKCQYHSNIDIELVDEENYFLNLSKHKEEVLNWLNSNPIIPQTHIKELISFINEYDEISVSRLRKNCPWGTIVPNDEEHTIFIWLSALCNYFIAADDWIGWNNCDVIQLYGVDNNRFQAHIFQSILSAIGYNHSHKMLIHGTILDKDGKKMSKTLGNVIDPIDQLDKWGLDAIRYYTLAGLNTTTDSGWDEERLVLQFNSDICNDWGNLFSRVMHLIDTKLGGNVNFTKNDFTKLVSTKEDQIVGLWHELKIKEALQKTNELVKFANRYVTDEKPWSGENYEEVLNNLYFLLEVVVSLYSYVFPHRTDIYEALDSKKKVILFTKIGSK